MNEKELIKIAKEFVSWCKEKGISNPKRTQLSSWAQEVYPTLTVTLGFQDIVWKEFTGAGNKEKKDTTKAFFIRRGKDDYITGIKSPTWKCEAQAGDHQLLMTLARIAKADGIEEFTKMIKANKLEKFLDIQVKKATRVKAEKENLFYVMSGDNAKWATMEKGQLVEKPIFNKVCASKARSIDLSSVENLEDFFSVVK